MSARWAWLEPVSSADGYGESLVSLYRRAAGILSRSLRQVVLESCVLSGINLRHLEMSSEEINGGVLYQTQLLVKALGQMTGRDDLHKTTLLRAFGKDQIRLRRTRAWCPACLDDPQPYSPLIWGLADYSTCVQHALRLQSSCPRCGRNEKRLLRRSNPQTCAWCAWPLSKSRLIEVEPSQRSVAALEAMRRYEDGDYHAFARPSKVAISPLPIPSSEG